MKTRCLVCLSEQKEYIEEMLRDEIPARTISERIAEVYEEFISYSALLRHKDHHMGFVSLEKRPTQEKSVTVTRVKQTREPSEPAKNKDAPEAPLTQIEALEARINTLEVVLAAITNTAQYTAFDSYSMAGKVVNKITYRDIACSSMPEKGNIDERYKAIALSIKAKMIADGGLVLSDDTFIIPRAELNKKSQEEVKRDLANAASESAKSEKEGRAFAQALEQLEAEEERNAQ